VKEKRMVALNAFALLRLFWTIWFNC